MSFSAIENHAPPIVITTAEAGLCLQHKNHAPPIEKMLKQQLDHDFYLNFRKPYFSYCHNKI